jgi:hypothetical protein
VRFEFVESEVPRSYPLCERIGVESVVLVHAPV